MTFSSIIPVAAVGFTTAMAGFTNLCDTMRPLKERAWYSASPDAQTIYVLFAGPSVLTGFNLFEIGSDMTTAGFAWDAHRIIGINHFSNRPIIERQDENIRRGGNLKGAMGFSSDNTGDGKRHLKKGWKYAREVDEPLRMDFDKPLLAIGVRIRIKAGHGWFGAIGFEGKGALRKAFSSRVLAKHVDWVKRESGVIWRPERLAA